MNTHSLERTVYLLRQQAIRERIGNKGGKDLYLTKRFIMKTKKNIFIKQLLSNCRVTLSTDFHNDTSNIEE